MKKNGLIGVTIFGVLTVLSSLVHMSKLIGDRQLYFEYYSYLPLWLAYARYSVSWTLRILGISSGIGILFYKDVFRKLLIIIGIFTICTVYWKHPYEGFKKHTAHLDKVYPEMIKNVSFSSLTIYAVVIHIMYDITYQGVLIYYFTRPDVKAKFKEND